MGDIVNESILQMVNNLKPGNSNSDLNKMEFTNSLKRPLSSNSNQSESNSSFDSLSSTTTPMKKPKCESPFSLNYVGSPSEMRRLRAELLESRNTILALESQIQHMHSVRKEMQVMFDNETKTLKRQHEHDTKTIDVLENKLKSLRKIETSLKEEIAEVKRDYTLLKIKNNDEIHNLEKSITELKENSRFNDSQELSELSELKRKLAELRNVLEAAEEDAEAQKKLVAELTKQLSVRKSCERELEIKEQALITARMRIRELEFAKENYLEYQEQAKNHVNKLVRYAEIEKENEKLKMENYRIKDDIHNKLILEEEVNSLKNRLINYKEHEKKLSTLQIQYVHIEMQLNEFKNVARSICETNDSESLPHLLRKTVEKLQQEEIYLTSTKVELESQLNSTLFELKMAKTEIEKNQKLIGDLKRSSDQKQTLIHRMQKKLLLVSRERDSYRQQLDSYEKDLTINLNSTHTQNQGSNNNNNNNNQKERIDNLEHIIESYREMVTKLENDLQNSQGDFQESPVSNDKLSRLYVEIERLKNENEKLCQRKDQLEIQLENYLIKDNDTLKCGQVLHMMKNPLKDALENRENTIEKLEEEKERLKRKIKKLEEGIETSKLNETTISSKDIQLLKEQIKSLESQNQHIKTICKTSMQDFRNVIYMLLGYKVDRVSSLYKLTSVYAEKPEDQLCFQLNDEGALNLLENNFSATLEDMINLHLRHQNSIPVFLSALTMDLFNSRTMTCKTYEIDD